MAHAEDAGNSRHRQAVGVGSSDGFITLFAHGFSLPLKIGFALGITLGEGRQAGAGIGGLAFGSGDTRIV